MSNIKNKLLMFDCYIKAGITPILLEDVNISNLKYAVILDAKDKLEEKVFLKNCDRRFLPKWYKKVLDNSNKNREKKNLLIIKNLNKISHEKQMKYLDMFKYKKIGYFSIPQNTIIIVVVSDLKEFEFKEEIYNLLAHVY